MHIPFTQWLDLPQHRLSLQVNDIKSELASLKSLILVTHAYLPTQILQVFYLEGLVLLQDLTTQGLASCIKQGLCHFVISTIKSILLN